jgi:hypothetical protein
MCDPQLENLARDLGDQLGVSLVLESYSYREMSFTASLRPEDVEHVVQIRHTLNLAAPPGTHVIVVIRDEDEMMPAPEPTSGPSRFARVEPV